MMDIILLETDYYSTVLDSMPVPWYKAPVPVAPLIIENTSASEFISTTRAPNTANIAYEECPKDNIDCDLIIEYDESFRENYDYYEIYDSRQVLQKFGSNHNRRICILVHLLKKPFPKIVGKRSHLETE